MQIEAQDVTKRYGAFTAVAGVSFTVQSGECLGLLGPNGAGKSTLISMIYGASPRSGGQLIVDGMDPEREARRLRQRLGVVTQENALDESMSVRENMLMFAGFYRVPKEQRDQKVDELLEFMNIAHKADATIRSLSGGMQRRLVFVRALLGDPALIILDEPTTGLDPAVRHLLWQKIQELKRSGVTIILTTHYMDEAEILCDRLLIMDQGKVATEGAPKALIRQHSPGFVAHFTPDDGAFARAEALARRDESYNITAHSAGFTLRTIDLPLLTAAVQTIATEPSMIRPANLEDVFLKITGRELAEHA